MAQFKHHQHPGVKAVGALAVVIGGKPMMTTAMAFLAIAAAVLSIVASALTIIVRVIELRNKRR